MSIAAKLILLLAVFVGGMMAGIKWHAGQDAIAEQARQVNQRATERLRRQNANTAAVAYEAARETVRTEFVTLRERVNVEVEKPVYRNICITADGLQQLADAARATGYSPEPGNPLPAASASK